MKNKLLSFIIMFGLIIQAQGQMLEFKNSRKISQRGENLSRLEIHELMKDNPESLHLYQSGKTLRTVGDITFFGGLIIAIGGVALNNLTDVGDKKHSINSYPWEGYYKGTFSEKNYTLSTVSLIVGGAMLVTTIPLKISGKKRIRESVKQYNESSQTTGVSNRIDYKLAIISNQEGVGIKLTF